MPQDHSFDIVSKPNIQEIENAIIMAMKEITARFDFKGSNTRIEKDNDKIKSEKCYGQDRKYFQ
jgi:uncharacterized protein YajQ (UPF0234 family)